MSAPTPPDDPANRGFESEGMGPGQTRQSFAQFQAAAGGSRDNQQGGPSQGPPGGPQPGGQGPGSGGQGGPGGPAAVQQQLPGVNQDVFRPSDGEGQQRPQLPPSMRMQADSQGYLRALFSRHPHPDIARLLQK